MAIKGQQQPQSVEEALLGLTPEEARSILERMAPGNLEGPGQEAAIPVVGGPGAQAAPQPPAGSLGGLAPGAQPGPTSLTPQNAPLPAPGLPQNQPGAPGQPGMQPPPQALPGDDAASRAQAEGASAGLGILGKLLGWGKKGVEGATKAAKHVQEVETFLKQHPHISVPADRIARLEETMDRRAKDVFRDRLKQPKPNGGRTLMDDVATTYVQSMLTGVGTQERNLVNNAMRIAEIIPMAFVEGVAGRAQQAFGDKTVHHVPSEASRMMFAIPEAFRRSIQGLRQAHTDIKAARAGVLSGVTKDETAFRNVFQASNSIWVQKIGNMWSKGTEGLVYADEAAKAFIRELEETRGAHMYAQYMGAGKSHAEKAKIYQALRKEKPSFLMDYVEREAHKGTMTQTLEGWPAEMSAFIGRHPTARFVVPFMTAPQNFAQQTFQRTPLLNLLSAENASMLARGGPDRDVALARYFVGGLLAWNLYNLAEEGFITGSGELYSPQYRAALKEAGWRPNSMWMGEDVGYVGLDTLGPWANGITFAATLWEVRDLVPEEQYYQMATHMVWALGTMMGTMPGVEATGHFFDILTSKDKVASLGKEAGTMAANVILPAALQEAARATNEGRIIRGKEGGDKTVGTFFKEFGKPMLDELANKVPGMQDEGELERGPLGGIITNYNPYLPVRRSPVNKRKLDLIMKLDPVVNMKIFDIRSYIGASGEPGVAGQPGLPGNIAGYTLTKRDRSQLLRLRGEVARPSGYSGSFVDAIEEYVNSPEWDAAHPDDAGSGSPRERKLKKIIKAYTMEAERLYNEQLTAEGQPNFKERKKEYKGEMRGRKSPGRE